MHAHTLKDDFEYAAKQNATRTWFELTGQWDWRFDSVAATNEINPEVGFFHCANVADGSLVTVGSANCD